MAAAALLIAGLAPTAAHATTGSSLWTATYQGTGGDSRGQAIAASPDGSMVYVTGISGGSGEAENYETIAYNAATGAKAWAASYSAEVSGNDADAVAVSPDGTEVFVTGSSANSSRGIDYATVAYNAHTGAQLWATRSKGKHGFNTAESIAVNGSDVFVTGYSSGPGDKEAGYATVAYDDSTGAQLWTATYAPAGSVSFAQSVTATSSTVIVTGYSEPGSSLEAATVAYSASSGAQLWVKTGKNGSVGDAAGVSPDGSTAYVFGGVTGAGNVSAFVTTAYNTATGAQRWTARYNGPTTDGTEPLDQYLKVSPDGSQVFVTGSVPEPGPDSNDAYATVAYNASTGARQWAAVYTGGQDENFPSAIAVSRDGGTVYVTGASRLSSTFYNYGTVAYAAGTGTMAWEHDFGSPSHGSQPTGLAATSSGVVVSGASPYQGHAVWATVAYAG
ncbi:MAG TPA: PQQ-binding-like beta-propeller repeat protein [Streptosporangiaceae bacterium]